MSPSGRCPLFQSRESWYYVFVLASRVAVRCANIKTTNMKAIVRTAVIIYVSFSNVRHHFVATLRIHAIIGACSKYISHAVRNKVELPTRTNNCQSIRLNMHFCTDMPESERPEPASRYHWDWVTFVVHPREVRHFRVKERSPGRVSNARRPKRDSSDSCTLRQIERHEQRVKFRDRSAK
jgi:hypothetical protein